MKDFIKVEPKTIKEIKPIEPEWRKWLTDLYKAMTGKNKKVEEEKGVEE